MLVLILFLRFVGNDTSFIGENPGRAELIAVGQMHRPVLPAQPFSFVLVDFVLQPDDEMF